MNNFWGSTYREKCDQLFYESPKMKVVFTKKNGDERTMICTRLLIPEEFVPKGTGEPKPPSDVVYPVFDLEAEGWRSFTFTSIISMEPV